MEAKADEKWPNHRSCVPDAAPDWITPKLIQQTKRVWQPYYSDPLTDDEVVAMIVGVGCLIDRLVGESP